MSKEKDDLIVAQQLEIRQLQLEASWHKSATTKIHRIIYGIGGPLNDNRLQYTKEQMRDFLEIAKELGLA